jgi:hypothetical protein
MIDLMDLSPKRWHWLPIAGAVPFEVPDGWDFEFMPPVRQARWLMAQTSLAALKPWYRLVVTSHGGIPERRDAGVTLATLAPTKRDRKSAATSTFCHACHALRVTLQETRAAACPPTQRGF